MSLIAQVTSYPYGISSPDPVRLLEEAGFTVRLSPHQRKHTSAETADLLGDVDVLVAGTEPLPAEVLQAGLPRLKHVARVGVGLDGLDVAFCQANGIAVTYTPDAPARSVVEQVFGLLICLGRRFIEAHEGMRQGKWNRLTGTLFTGKTLGILGCGRIGKQVAEIARAMRMHVLAHDIVEDSQWAQAHGVRYVDLPELLRSSTALTIHLPLTDRTEDIIGGKELALLPRGAYVLNTCRGEVLDEDALYRALQDGHLGGAALDVYRKEPYQGPLQTLPNVILCCHQGSCSHDGRYAMEMGAAENTVTYLQGSTITTDRVVWLPGMDAPAVSYR
ncbi:MAG: dehydrogenase [Planctomycetota bacterium]|nr:MAG: dehydrogenase [Planctomycetota bacterium]